MKNNRLSFLVLLFLLPLSCPLQLWSQPLDWDNIESKGKPWVKNTSEPNRISHGLSGHHISVWASHGRYYDVQTSKWEWQRPSLFCTNEDLFTQTIVVPYLIPMLENAGAVVFTPRERDWQRHEVIVDNDQIAPLINYQEQNYRKPWTKTAAPGFAYHEGFYHDGENPFIAGTARMAETTRSKSKISTASYQPNLPEEGRYAVYVSYQTIEGSVDDAHYTVWHKGEKTEFRVNQRMGGSTWVYLGTFDFDKGSNIWNRVIVSNNSSRSGHVTTDAVRFGGGMGNIERGGKTSGLPRCLEGARYYAQWAGMPYSVYSSKNGTNDYNDDINARSLMTNYLCGGSPYAPDEKGGKVPIELSLAIHSDAGHTKTGLGVYGSLSICTTQQGHPVLGAGNSRGMSVDLANKLLANVDKDLRKTYGEWNIREVYDRNYSESRLPKVPSAILETMSHQNFGDMRYGHDPNFRFTLARSVYKTVLQYICDKHDKSATVTPLAPQNFRIEFSGRHGEARLTWTGTKDPLESSAKPTGYIVYTAQGTGGFDNGTQVSGTHYSLRLSPGILYSFKVCAINKGGRSFPTQTLSALYTPDAKQTVLIVDGFHRLSSPAIQGQGFRLDVDEGVTYGRTAGWLGSQQVFDTNQLGKVGPTALGYSSDELAGKFIAGNEFNYVRTHAEAIETARKYNIVSCSSEAILQMRLDKYDLIDLILGLEYDDGHSLVKYKAIPLHLREALRAVTILGKSLLVSGAYVGADAVAPEEKMFLQQVLKCQFEGKSLCKSELIRGMGTQFDIFHHLNEHHYAATHSDMLMPTDKAAFCVMAYDDNTSAGVAYQGSDYRTLTMGFPFECIKHAAQRNVIMQGMLNFLLQQNH